MLKASTKEMEQVAESLGRTSLNEIDKSDLCALDPFLASSIGVEFGYVAPEYQHNLIMDGFLSQSQRQSIFSQAPLH